MATGLKRLSMWHWASHWFSCGQTRPQIDGSGLAPRRICAALGMSPAATAWMKSGIGMFTGQPSTQAASWQRRHRSASKAAWAGV